ncbi:helix-hairpin-helix domain-containing protein [Ferrimonas lipolytica]|uniref:Helix-hairpin-helix domain-containing protein n=2 Tax=Ferrimonas lipolytica TaxID=2724191 RepID=A0A6H1UJJ2_9GAMM|nr:helix-hairpin-helix domain-containing protein [Ferrimonas lipolytica]
MSADKGTTTAAVKAPVSATSKAQSSKNRVNINSASATQLANGLTGIGAKKAQAIVEFRSTHGKFKNINELSKVKGIGAELIAKNIERIAL